MSTRTDAAERWRLHDAAENPKREDHRVTTSDAQSKCCEHGLFFGPDGDRTRQHCWRHTPQEDRDLIHECDQRGGAIGLRRSQSWRAGASLSWPYGPNISVPSRVRLLDWAEAHGLRQAHPSHPCLRWLTKGRCMVAVCDAHQSRPGWWDHVTTWNRDSRPAVLVAQPYGLTDDDRADLARLGAGPGIHVETRPDSWYGYGTTFVGVWRAEAFAAAAAGKDES